MNPFLPHQPHLPRKHRLSPIRPDGDNFHRLSDEFGEFNVVQLGSVMLAPKGGWEYVPVGIGFKGDFNDVLGNFC